MAFHRLFAGGNIGQVRKREQNQLRTLAATAAEPMRIAKLSGPEELADVRVEWEALHARSHRHYGLACGGTTCGDNGLCCEMSSFATPCATPTAASSPSRR